MSAARARRGLLAEHVHADVWTALMDRPELPLYGRLQARARDRLARYLAPHLPLGSRWERRGLAALIDGRCYAERAERRRVPLALATREGIALRGVELGIALARSGEPQVYRFGSAGAGQELPAPPGLVGAPIVEPRIIGLSARAFDPRQVTAFGAGTWWVLTAASHAARALLQMLGEEPEDPRGWTGLSLDRPGGDGGRATHETGAISTRAPGGWGWATEPAPELATPAAFAERAAKRQQIAELAAVATEDQREVLRQLAIRIETGDDRRRTDLERQHLYNLRKRARRLGIL